MVPSVQGCLFRYHFDPVSYWFQFVSTVAGTLFIREESAKRETGLEEFSGTRFEETTITLNSVNEYEKKNQQGVGKV